MTYVLLTPPPPKKKKKKNTEREKKVQARVGQFKKHSVADFEDKIRDDVTCVWGLEGLRVTCVWGFCNGSYGRRGSLKVTAGYIALNQISLTNNIGTVCRLGSMDSLKILIS